MATVENSDANTECTFLTT